MRQFACVNTERKGDAPHQQRTYIAAAGLYLGMQQTFDCQYIPGKLSCKEGERKEKSHI
jgi:hypothetical protein